MPSKAACSINASNQTTNSHGIRSGAACCACQFWPGERQSKTQQKAKSDSIGSSAELQRGLAICRLQRPAARQGEVLRKGKYQRDVDVPCRIGRSWQHCASPDGCRCAILTTRLKCLSASSCRREFRPPLRSLFLCVRTRARAMCEGSSICHVSCSPIAWANTAREYAREYLFGCLFEDASQSCSHSTTCLW